MVGMTHPARKPHRIGWRIVVTLVLVTGWVLAGLLMAPPAHSGAGRPDGTVTFSRAVEFPQSNG